MCDFQKSLVYFPALKPEPIKLQRNVLLAVSSFAKQKLTNHGSLHEITHFSQNAN